MLVFHAYLPFPSTHVVGRISECSTSNTSSPSKEKKHQIYRQPNRRIDQPNPKKHPSDPSVFRLYKDVPRVFIKAFLYGFRQGSFNYPFMGGMQMYANVWSFPGISVVFFLQEVWVGVIIDDSCQVTAKEISSDYHVVGLR